MSISWSAIQSIEEPDVIQHFDRALPLGLSCPMDVFEQLFHGHADDQGFAGVVRFIDWSNVLWEEIQLSGIALRRVTVHRDYQSAVDEVRHGTLESGVQDERPEVMEHWLSAHTWLRSPIIVDGEVIGSPLGDECLIGFRRLGNLLGLLDRGDIPEADLHRVWIGRQQVVRHTAPEW